MKCIPLDAHKRLRILLPRLHLPSSGEGFIYYCCESIAIVVGWKSIFNGINKGAFITKSYRWQIGDERDAHQIYNFPPEDLNCHLVALYHRRDFLIRSNLINGSKCYDRKLYK